MTITIYSRKFKRELDARQLKSLFFDSNENQKLSFKEFIKADIECPICNVTGGHYVSEGSSQLTGKVVKQAHFAFRDNQGNDTHLQFCDFYTGIDKINSVSNDGRVNFMRSGTEVTGLIGFMVCAGIEGKIFSQQDIRNMRQWFLDLRKQGAFIFNLNPHILNIAKASLIRNKRNKNAYVFDIKESENEWFDIDNEVYQSLYFKFPFLKIDTSENKELYDIRLKGVTKKSISIIRKDSGVTTFDRTILAEEYIRATRIALIIRDSNPRLKKLLGSSISRVRENNPLIALAALLLFISNWDESEAKKNINEILKIKSVINDTAGNIIGLNPFIHYKSWVLVKALHDLQLNTDIKIDFDAEFNLEKERLINLYYPK
ncbi:hypothetical protein PMAL9190_03895 [Photobacterium malacitanum]|uniref:Uncharacterized protein n=1 Tax=Photobacterium malacitanum TaxID=2204294 RepID=A0A1Y6MRA3_9GAMM|nr:hypothetical protein [Photobacterium malacitanum]SMY39094.1 hypothetical protein PMAL9190_03895 [Photobacterium malacitanum]